MTSDLRLRSLSWEAVQWMTLPESNEPAFEGVKPPDVIAFLVRDARRYFSVLNHDSELSRIRDNSDYPGLVIMPSMNLREHVCAGQRTAAA